MTGQMSKLVVLDGVDIDSDVALQRDNLLKLEWISMFPQMAAVTIKAGGQTLPVVLID